MTSLLSAGVLEAEFYEADVEVIPMTYPFATSHIWWPINQAEELNIKFDFRSSRTTAVLAYSDVTTPKGSGFWEVCSLTYLSVLRHHTACTSLDTYSHILGVENSSSSHWDHMYTSFSRSYGEIFRTSLKEIAKTL